MLLQLVTCILIKCRYSVSSLKRRQLVSAVHDLLEDKKFRKRLDDLLKEHNALEQASMFDSLTPQDRSRLLSISSSVKAVNDLVACDHTYQVFCLHKVNCLYSLLLVTR